MLPSKILQFPLSSGLAEGSDPKQVPPGTLTRAKNVYWKKTNLLEKRCGTEELLDPDVITAQRLFVRGDELSVIGAVTPGTLSNAAAIKTFSAPGGVLASGTWTTARNQGFVPEVGLTWSTLSDSIDGACASDVAVSALGYACHAYIAGDPENGSTLNLYFHVVDTSTGSRISEPVLLSTGASTVVRVLVSGETFIILWADGATAIKYWIQGGGIGPGSGTLRNDAGNHVVFDACMIGANFVIAYSRPIGSGIDLYSYSVASPPVQQATGTVTGEIRSLRAISIDGDAADLLWIAYFADVVAEFVLATADPVTLVQALVPTLIGSPGVPILPTVSVMRYDSTHCCYAFSCTSLALPDLVQDGKLSTQFVSSVGAITTPLATFNMKVLSRPFMLGGTPYIFAANYLRPTGAALIANVPTSGSVDSYLIGIERTSSVAGERSHKYVGHVDLLIGGNWIQDQSANVTVIGNEALFGAPYQSSITGSYAGIRQGIRLVRATVGGSRPKDYWRPLNIGQETYLVAGVFSAYDGRMSFDYGMSGPPLIDRSTATINAGGSQATGTYLYSVVPEYRSWAGILHRGPPATTFTIAVTGPNGTTTLAIVPVSLSSKSTNVPTSSVEPIRVVLALYRSVVGGANLQRLTVEPVYNTLYQATIPPSSPQTFADTRLDTNIGASNLPLASRPVIYTGSVLPDYQPPAPVTGFYHADRLFLLAGDERTWWYSKTFQDDIGVAPGFHPNFRIMFPERMVAGASMDEKGVFFSETSIWYMLGTGPAPNGTNSDFTAPLKIQTDSGCTNPRSVVSTPEGIMFEGFGDIFLLTRGLEVVWIGRPVLEQLELFPVITSAVLISKRNEVRLTCNDASGELGIVLVYNYVEKQWTTFEYTSDTTVGLAIADALLWQDRYTYVTVNGLVYRESEDTNLDAGDQWVEMDVETAEIYAEGPLSYQRVRRAYLNGSLLTQCDLQLRVAVNGEATYVQTRDFASATTLGLGTAKVGVHVKRQKNDSIRLRITDAPPSSLGLDRGIGKGINLSSIGFEIAPKQGMNKRAPEATK